MQIRDLTTETVKHGHESTNSRWYVLFVLVCGYILYILDKQIIGVLIEPIKAEFDLSDTTMSLLAGLASTIPFALACIPIGMLSDRFNRKNLLVILIIGWSLMTGMAGLATSIALLFVSRAGVGAFESGFTPISMSIISDSFPSKIRGTAIGIFGMSTPIGAFIAFAVGGWVAEAYGWRMAFFLALIPGIVVALVIALTIREPQRGRYDPPNQTNSLPLVTALKFIWGDRALFHILVGMALCTVLAAVMSVWTPSYLIRVHGMTIKEAGLSSSIAIGIFGALGAFSAGFISDYLGRQEKWRRLLSAALGTALTIIVAPILFLGEQGPTTAVVLLSILAFFVQFIQAPGYSAASTLCPPRLRGTTISLLLVAMNVFAYGLGVLLLGVLNDYFNPTLGEGAIAYGMFISSVFSIVGLAFFIRGMHLIRINRRLESTIE